MRKIKFNENTYNKASKQLVRQVLAMAQEDALDVCRDEDSAEGMTDTEVRGSDEYIDALEDYANDYMSDANEQLNEALAQALSGKQEV